MGIYTIARKLSQSLFLFFFRGGWAPRSQAQPIRVCDTIDHLHYGILCYLYFIDKKSIERRDKMSKETLKETVNKITHLDSMKAVKVAFDLSESNQDSINKVMQVVGGNVNNINTLAEGVGTLTKEIAKIKKILARFQMTEGLNDRSN